MRRCDDDYQDDLRLYSAGPRSPSVISESISFTSILSSSTMVEMFHGRNYQLSLVLGVIIIDKWRNACKFTHA